MVDEKRTNSECKRSFELITVAWENMVFPTHLSWFWPWSIIEQKPVLSGHDLHGVFPEFIDEKPFENRLKYSKTLNRFNVGHVGWFRCDMISINLYRGAVFPPMNGLHALQYHLLFRLFLLSSTWIRQKTQPFCIGLNSALLHKDKSIVDLIPNSCFFSITWLLISSMLLTEVLGHLITSEKPRPCFLILQH
jgi:hypothetical protein